MSLSICLFYQNHICEPIEVHHLPYKSSTNQLVHLLSNRLCHSRVKLCFFYLIGQYIGSHIQLMHHHFGSIFGMSIGNQMKTSAFSYKKNNKIVFGYSSKLDLIWTVCSLFPSSKRILTKSLRFSMLHSKIISSVQSFNKECLRLFCFV